MNEIRQQVEAKLSPRKYSGLVFFTALSCLMLELFLSRMASFHLGQSYSYLAIPVTFLGLSIGGFHVHLSRSRILNTFKITRHALTLLVLTVISVISLFLIFRYVFPVVYEGRTRSASADHLWRTLAFVAIGLGPFYVTGRILSVVYYINRERISSIYSADLWGAALACFITPILFHLFDINKVLLVCIAATSITFLIFQKSSLRIKFATGVLFILGLIGVNYLILYIESDLDFSNFKRRSREYEPIQHGWNEFSRVTLLRATSRNNGHVRYEIVHDNGLSNVAIERYRPEKVTQANSEHNEYSPYNVSQMLGRQTKNILVMFAGCGAEMLRFNEQSSGQANVTGVEINQLVRDLAVQSSSISNYRLQEFYNLPNINLVIKEGRHFLDEDRGHYDVIFMGRDAALGVHLTGHTRKYLDTMEAYEAYLQHLTPTGLLVFYNKPLGKRLLTLRAAHNRLGKALFENKIVILDNRRMAADMLYSESGFTTEDVALLEKSAPEAGYRVVYAPNRRNNQKLWQDLVHGIDTRNYGIMTDDIPFLRGLNLSDYTLAPPTGSGSFLGWAKISTLLIITFLTIAILAIVSIRKETRPPPSVLTYLLITGFCYMLSEIALMAKLELFLKDPLLSMATVLSVFLVAGGIGSRLVRLLAAKLDMRLVPFGVILVLYGSIHLFNLMNMHLIMLPTFIKLILAVLAVAPVGVSLGLFYPYLVTSLVKNRMDHVVPLTYGISTLSSVIGVTYAMTAMLEFGFNNLLYQAMVGYGLLGLFVFLYLISPSRQLLRIQR